MAPKTGSWRRTTRTASKRALIRVDPGAERGLVYPNLLSVLPSIRTIQQPNLHFTQNRRLEITCIHARV